MSEVQEDWVARNTAWQRAALLCERESFVRALERDFGIDGNVLSSLDANVQIIDLNEEMMGAGNRYLPVPASFVTLSHEGVDLILVVADSRTFTDEDGARLTGGQPCAVVAVNGEWIRTNAYEIGPLEVFSFLLQFVSGGRNRWLVDRDRAVSRGRIVSSADDLQTAIDSAVMAARTPWTEADRQQFLDRLFETARESSGRGSTDTS